MSHIPARMTAIGIREPGGPEVLVPQERAGAAAGRGEMLVKVAAAGVNRPDVMQRKGLYPPPPGAPDIPGLEIAGEVVALGDGVTRWKIGDHVMALVPGGGYAEYCARAREPRAAGPAGALDGRSRRDPGDLLHGLAQRVRARRAQSRRDLLVHGGSSGIGTTAIQLAKRFGARVIVTAGSDEKCDACRKLGADVAINYKTQDFVAETKKATDGKGADVILDMVGGDYIERNYEAAAVEGRIVQIAFQGAPKATVDFRRIMLKRLHHTGSTLRPRPVATRPRSRARSRRRCCR